MTYIAKSIQGVTKEMCLAESTYPAKRVWRENTR
jgi:hypothetical protein